jgi:hypothetical protein
MPLLVAIITIAILCGWLASIVLAVLWFAGVAPVASWSAAGVFGPAIVAAVAGYLLRIFSEDK